MTVARGIGVLAMAVAFCGLLPASAMSAENHKVTRHTTVRADSAEPRVAIGRVHTNFSPNARLIAPCWYVRNDIYQRALADANIGVVITLRYLSGGDLVRRRFHIAIKDAIVPGANDAVVAPPSTDYTPE